MKSLHPYAIVDVFADRPLTGNPLAVVTDADDLSENQMAAIAVEFNLSETTFVSRPTMNDANFRLRSFTPGGDEVSGAGHNALGAWWWLATMGAATPPRANQELGGRVLPILIDVTGGRLSISLDQGPVEIVEAQLDQRELGEVLGSRVPVKLDAALPPVTGSVGSVHLLIALESMSEVDAVAPDGSKLAKALSVAGVQGCYVYSLATEDRPYDAYCRFFNPTVGIAEDPATGSAAGPLAAHLNRLGLVGREARLLQGQSLGRPSVLELASDPAGTTLTGRCALTATGELQI